MVTTPLKDFGVVLKRIFRFVRVASYGLIALMVVFLAFRVAEIYRFLADIHTLFGVAFLLAFFAAFYWFIGRPLYRFFRMPVVVRPPDLPPPAERKPQDVVRYLKFVETYVAGLPKNPMWEGSPEQVSNAIATVRSLRDRAAQTKTSDAATMKSLHSELVKLERGTVNELLAPLDKRAQEVIRREALAVGIATAVSWNGTIDAFFVLWRNCNLVSHLGKIYYGRPGVRGTLSILRDVSAATIASAYLQDLSEVAGGAVGSVFGKNIGLLAAPLLDGGINAVATLRIGHLAKARCRAFCSWREPSTVEAVGGALKEAAGFSKDVVAEIIKTVGGGVLKLPGKILNTVGDSLSGLWRMIRDDDSEPDPVANPQPGTA